ncbi:MAG: hypothetical protein R3D63_09425 [Paracoccaceae bacterium]
MSIRSSRSTTSPISEVERMVITSPAMTEFVTFMFETTSSTGDSRSCRVSIRIWA